MRKLLNMVLAATLIVVSLVASDSHAQWISYAPLAVDVTNTSRIVLPAVENVANGTNVWKTATAYTRDTYVWNYGTAYTNQQYFIYGAGTSTSAVPPTAIDGDDTADAAVTYRRVRPRRNGFILCNASTTTMYLAFGKTNSAVASRGIVLQAGEVFRSEKPNPITLGEVKAICGSAVAEVLTVQEW